MYDFEREFQVEQRVKLEQNYRSVSHILDCANGLISHNEKRLGKTLWTAAGDGDKPRVFEAPTDLDEARFLIEEIGGQLRIGTAPKDIALLYRSNAQSRVLEHQLFSSGVAYKVYGGLRFFERAEIKDALAYLRLISNRNDDPSFERVVNLPTRGIGAKSLDTLRGEARAYSQSLWTAAQRLGSGHIPAFLALVERGQAKGLRIGPEIAHRVGIEGGDDAGTAFSPRPCQRLADHGLMAEMEAIEIAQRDDGAPQAFGHRFTVVEANHGLGYRSRSKVTQAKPGRP